MAALVLTGCSTPSSADPAPTAAAGTTSPSAGAPVAADPGDDAEPTDVAGDAPVEAGPGADQEVVVSHAAVGPAGDAVEVSGFVPGLVEDGGRCVLVLGRTGHTDVTVEDEAFAEAQSTACALLSVPVDRLAPGVWTARLDYRSDVSSGSSEDVEVVVP
ncbi:hypothetical protein [Blastococcus sp. TF02A-35]|uniref:hypothetical protein n=1 Tax=Blastococcus sp. TF02A-35 TaxID=2559612 RepID=UPI0010730DE8|nr:hypothetical protein [Blastococcus sp. TF02A_35]TFV53596.1 hypothetical protein E4P43_01535 [Blastococcus sp. TF02A_35]